MQSSVLTSTRTSHALILTSTPNLWQVQSVLNKSHHPKPNMIYHITMYFLGCCLLLKAIFCWRSSSVAGCLLLTVVVWQRSSSVICICLSSINDHNLLMIVICWGLSTKGCFYDGPLLSQIKVVFHKRLSSFKGSLPSMVIFHQR